MADNTIQLKNQGMGHIKAVNTKHPSSKLLSKAPFHFSLNARY